jgi:hypothetical protein
MFTCCEDTEKRGSVRIDMREISKQDWISGTSLGGSSNSDHISRNTSLPLKSTSQRGMFAEGVSEFLCPTINDKAAVFAGFLADVFARYAHKKDPQTVINAFDQFTDPSHDDRQQRCIAVGFCREGDIILFKHAAFERHLKLRRSSVDNMFRTIGYKSCTGIRRLEIIQQMLPSLAGQRDARKWCVRVRKPM